MAGQVYLVAHTLNLENEDLKLEGLPLWQALFGFFDFVITKKKDPGYLESYMLVVKSPALHMVGGTSTRGYYPLIDKNFVDGKAPWLEYLDKNMKAKWWPKCRYQQMSVNDIVEAGPFVPKLNNDRESTWELNYFYQFYFKWGGPQVADQPVSDPKQQDTYPVPDSGLQTIQISNPTKQKWETIFHPWDYRRGSIKEKALKRMYENLSIDTDFQPDSPTGSPRKKKSRMQPLLTSHQKETQEIQTCLRSLFEEDTCQEIQEETDLKQLILQQQQQQRDLKHNILKLITEMKTKQQMLQLQTGLLD